MINIDAALDYTVSIKNAFLNGNDSQELDVRIKSIQRKRKDSKLYLAVIGEFNSGKSTFINALLGFRLLKEAVMPTTACATYIECNARSFALKVSFYDGNKFNVSQSDYSDLQEYLYTKYSAKCEDFLHIVSILTSDQIIARTVKTLNIKVPGNAIPKNIVIIDTPGFNPGDPFVENHQEITKNVVENIADTAIILTSQEQPMSATLSRFLNTNLKRCLHRCTYVVTKIDTLNDVNARKKIMEYVRQRISNDLMVQNPKLFELSAVTMLPIKRIPSGIENEWELLKNSFSDFMRLTWAELKKSKEYVLTEHINLLVRDVVLLCVEKLDIKQNNLQSDKDFLELHRIETVQTVCHEMVVMASSEIDKTISSLDISFSSGENRSKSSAESTINEGVMSLNNFTSIMMPKIKSCVENEAQQILSSLSKSVNRKVEICVRNQISKMSQMFSSHYKQFPTLESVETIPSVNLVRFKKPNLNFNIALSKIKALDSEENRVAGGGAAAGAGIGFLIGGPIGAAIGGIGGLIFGLGAGDQSSSMRSSAIPVVKNEIALFFSSLKKSVDNEMSSLKTKNINLIKSFAKEHILKYGTSVQELILERQNKIKDLDCQIKNLHCTINNLQNLQDEIEYELAILKTK